MSLVVLDASVVLAAILGEPGGDTVFERIGSAVISAVNVAEVYTYAAINEFPTPAIDAFFNETGIEIAPFTHDLAIDTGRLAALTRKAGLSLGDRACLALAILRDAEVLTADRAWSQIAEAAGVTVTLLR